MTNIKKTYITFLTVMTFWTIYEIFKRGVDFAHILSVFIIYWIFPYFIASVVYWIYKKQKKIE